MNGRLITATALLLASCLKVIAQQPSTKPPAVVAGIPVNYQEDSVGVYTLPDLLRCSDGQLVTSARIWTQKRRPELLKLVEETQFGKMPPRPKAMRHFTDSSRYQYQFATNYHTYANKVSRLPFDGHALVALMAPRPLLLQTGSTDYWSDPKGEFLSAVAAAPVYRLFGEAGPETTVMPVAGDTSLLMNPLGYFMHEGGHTVLPTDWPLIIAYLKKYL